MIVSFRADGQTLSPNRRFEAEAGDGVAARELVDLLVVQAGLLAQRGREDSMVLGQVAWAWG